MSQTKEVIKSLILIPREANSTSRIRVNFYRLDVNVPMKGTMFNATLMKENLNASVVSFLLDFERIERQASSYMPCWSPAFVGANWKMKNPIVGIKRQEARSTSKQSYLLKINI